MLCVSSGHACPGRNHESKLGLWLHYVRLSLKQGLLSEAKVTALKAVGVEFDGRKAQAIREQKVWGKGKGGQCAKRAQLSALVPSEAGDEQIEPWSRDMASASHAAKPVGCLPQGISEKMPPCITRTWLGDARPAISTMSASTLQREASKAKEGAGAGLPIAMQLASPARGLLMLGGGWKAAAANGSAARGGDSLVQALLCAHAKVTQADANIARKRGKDAPAKRLHVSLAQGIRFKEPQPKLRDRPSGKGKLQNKTTTNRKQNLAVKAALTGEKAGVCVVGGRQAERTNDEDMAGSMEEVDGGGSRGAELITVKSRELKVRRQTNANVQTKHSRCFQRPFACPMLRHSIRKIGQLTNIALAGAAGIKCGGSPARSPCMRRRQPPLPSCRYPRRARRGGRGR